MTGRELRSAIKTLNLSQAGLARLLDVNENTIRRWKLDAKIPGPVAAYVNLSLEIKKLAALTTPTPRR